MKPSRGWRLAAVAAVALSAACSGAEGASEGATAEMAPIVLGPRDVAVAARADLVVGTPVSGTLTPAVDVNITAPLAELLDAVLVKEGQRVAQGQLLARFRTGVAGAAALSAEAQRRVAEADYERMQNLLKEGAVSARDVENALVALRAAQAQEAAAQSRLSDAMVRAPIAGVVAERHVQSGDRVGDGDPLFRIVNISELEFEAQVPSDKALQVRAGAPVSLTVAGLEPALGGRVSRVNATADPATRQIEVFVTVPNRDGRLVGGLFASGRVVLREVRGALAIPQMGVRTGPDGQHYVLVIEDGRLARRAVTAGVSDEQAGLVEIVSGLQGGEQVVIGPGEGLAPGQAVELAGREG